MLRRLRYQPYDDVDSLRNVAVSVKRYLSAE